ncbi:hypothetical protein VTK26DRAFT_8936 [Humicola hyalothermophila]
MADSVPIELFGIGHGRDVTHIRKAAGNAGQASMSASTGVGSHSITGSEESGNACRTVPPPRPMPPSDSSTDSIPGGITAVAMSGPPFAPTEPANDSHPAGRPCTTDRPDLSPLEQYLAVPGRHEVLALWLSSKPGDVIQATANTTHGPEPEDTHQQLPSASEFYRCLTDVLQAHKQLGLVLERLSRVLEPPSLPTQQSPESSNPSSSISLSHGTGMDQVQEENEESNLFVSIQTMLAKIEAQRRQWAMSGEDRPRMYRCQRTRQRRCTAATQERERKTAMSEGSGP